MVLLKYFQDYYAHMGIFIFDFDVLTHSCKFKPIYIKCLHPTRENCYLYTCQIVLKENINMKHHISIYSLFLYHKLAKGLFYIKYIFIFKSSWSISIENVAIAFINVQGFASSYKSRVFLLQQFF